MKYFNTSTKTWHTINANGATFKCSDQNKGSSLETEISESEAAQIIQNAKEKAYKIIEQKGWDVAHFKQNFDKYCVVFKDYGAMKLQNYHSEDTIKRFIACCCIIKETEPTLPIIPQRLLIYFDNPKDYQHYLYNSLNAGDEVFEPYTKEDLENSETLQNFISTYIEKVF